MCLHKRALLRVGLLLFLLHLGTCLEGCVLCIVGQPVALPCLYPELNPFGNFSIEWRKNDQKLLSSQWRDDGNVEICSLNYARIPDDAAQNGNFSLELPKVHPKQDKMNFSLFFSAGENESTELCTLCLRVAASFSPPELQSEETAEGNETTFLCLSGGGYPEPVVTWLISDSLKPPEGSVRTLAEPHPESQLYNVTSYLTVNISKDSSVTCIIENPSMNESLRVTRYGASSTAMVGRASEAMWIFSTVLCVVVGIMVMAGVAYQIHLDRLTKRRKKENREEQRGYKRKFQFMEETEAMTVDKKETDV
ncbi:ICOS ligand-like [Oryzias latipes]|uniref:ICOS ligand-like n=1 Tax=Oryzias latipes TaxID=8090 RepID=UPI0002A4B2B8|nr:ICOS ligand-like [Oryzias latipes]